MPRLNRPALFFLAAVLTGLGGCLPDMLNQAPEILSVTPADGSVDVSRNTTIQVEFDQPMNHTSCQSRFGLHRGELADMPDPAVMTGLPGTFHWNAAQTLLTFVPDSLLRDSTHYTICLMEGMQAADNHRSMHRGQMSGHGLWRSGGLLSEFQTK